MKKRATFLTAVIFTACLVVVLLWIFRPQLVHLWEQYEERQRQAVLDGKLQVLIKEVELDKDEQGEVPRLRPIAREIVGFICSTWSNQEDRVQGLLKMESSLHNIDTARSLVEEGRSPVWMIYELTGEIMNGFNGMEDSEVKIWKMQIRALERVKKDLDLATKLLAVEPADSKKRRILKSLTSYTDRNYHHRVGTYESHFNTDIEWERLSADQAREVRAYFEHSLGRPIRTDAQIMDEGKRRLPKHPLDDDAKIDLGL